jgi:hypothetical protein
MFWPNDQSHCNPKGSIKTQAQNETKTLTKAGTLGEG